MSSLSGLIHVGQHLFEESETRIHKLGALSVDEYGNRFRYVKFGAALTTGNLLQESVEVTNFRSMNVAAASAIDATTVTVDLGGTAVTASLFDQGLLNVESSTGIGQTYRINSHTVQTSTTGECTFTIDRPLKIALVLDTSQVTVRKNPYDGVIQYPVTTQTGGVVGVALYGNTTQYYGWIQSGGDVACLWDNGTNSSNGVSGVGPSSAVAGSVKPQTGAEGGIVIGYSREVASTDSTMGVVHLNID